MLNLVAVGLVLNQQQVVDAKLSDIARERVVLAGERGEVEAAKAQLIAINRQIDAQTIVIEDQKVDLRDLDQRKLERDSAIAAAR